MTYGEWRKEADRLEALAKRDAELHGTGPLASVAVQVLDLMHHSLLCPLRDLPGGGHEW